MHGTFAQKLAVGGKKNSLGLAGEVVEVVLQDKSCLDELYGCLFEPDAWLRMRAADSLEKVCRVYPEWFAPYTDRMLRDMGGSGQPSLQWHLAQMLGEVTLTPAQSRAALRWLEERLRDEDVDWIVAANAMSTLAQFAKEGRIAMPKAAALIGGQRNHHSQSVRRRAQKLLDGLENG